MLLLMFIFSHVSINEFTDLSDIFIVFFKHIIFHSLPVNTVDQLFRVIKGHFVLFPLSVTFFLLPLSEWEQQQQLNVFLK